MYDWFFIQYTLLDFMALLWTNKKRLFLYKTITLQLYSLTWVILDLTVWIRKVCFNVFFAIIFLSE